MLTIFVGMVLGVSLVLTAALTDIDSIKLHLKLLDGIEKHEVDDILSGFAVIFAGLALDRFFEERRKRVQSETVEQRLRVLESTMRRVQDNVDHSLKALQLFRTRAAGMLPDGSLESVDELIEQTSVQLKSLGPRFGT